MYIEIPNQFTVDFTWKADANATASQKCTITVDISDMSATDLQEWMCNNGIIVYLQGRVRAGKLHNGDTYKLHKPGTRTVNVAILEGKQLEDARTLLMSVGKATADMSAEDVTIAFHEFRRALERIKKGSK